MCGTFVADGGDDVALHDLHVVDVVEQLDPRRADALHDLDAPRGVIGLVVVMVHLAVEQLQAQGHAMLARLSGARRCRPAMQLAMPSASDSPARLPLKHTMFGTPAAAARGIMRSPSATSRSCWSRPVESHGDRPEAVRHRAGEAVPPRHRPVRLVQQLDRAVADRLRRLAQLVERDAAVAPARHRLPQAAAAQRPPARPARASGAFRR